MKKIRPAFSYIFHPLFIPVYATLFYFFVTRNFFYEHEVYLIFIQVLILTLLLPISLYYLLNSLGLIKSKMMLDKKERKLPLAFHAMFMVILIEHSFSDVVLPELYYYFMGYVISNLIALALLLFRYKISLHMLGISTLTIFVTSISAYYHIQFLYVIALLILCMGFTASSRLQLKAHTMGELALGTLIGALPQIGLWFIWLLPGL